MEKEIKKNKIKNIIYCCLIGASLEIACNTIIQSFLLQCNIAESKVSFYVSLCSIFQVVIMFAYSFFADKAKYLKKQCSICTIVSVIIFIPLIFSSDFLKQGENTFLTILIICSALAYLGIGVYNVLSNKISYELYELKDFGKISSLSLLTTSLVTFTLNTIVAVLATTVDYFKVMYVTFILGAVFLVISFFICLSYKSLPINGIEENHNKEAHDVNVLELIKMPVFYKLVPYHLLRGFAVGIVAIAILLGTKAGAISAGESVIVSVLSMGSQGLASIVYILFEKKYNPAKIMNIFTILVVICFPLSLVFKSSITFYIFYFLTFFGISVISLAIPMTMYKIVPEKIYGKYTAYRILMMYLGKALAQAFVGLVIDSVPAIVIAVIGVILQVYCAFANNKAYNKYLIEENN